ncbi:MAG: PAS domain-containing protein [Planctomycetota bacterium]
MPGRLLVVLIVILPACLLALGLWQLVDDWRLEHQHEQLHTRTGQLAETIALLASDEVERHLAVLSAHPAVRRSLTLGQVDPVATTLCGAFASSLEASNVYVLDRQGTVILSSSFTIDPGETRSLVGNNYAFRPYFQEALAGRPQVYPALGVTTQQRGIYCSHPVHSRDGRILGVAVIKQGLQRLDRLLAQETATALLLSADGIVFASNRPDLLYRSLPDLDAQRRTAIRAKRQFGNADLEPLPWNPQQLGPEQLSSTANLTTGWGLILRERPDPTYPLDREARHLLWFTAGLGCVAVVVILLLSLAIRTRLHAERAIAESEARFRGIFDNAFQYIGLLDPSGVLLDANAATLRITGRLRHEVVGRHLADLPLWAHDETQRTRLQAAITQAAAGELVHYEARPMDPDGRIRDIDFSIVPLRDAAGRVRLLIPEGRDITDRRRAERLLAAERAHLHSILDAIGDAVIATDADARVVRLNPAAAELTGWSADEARDQALATVFRISRTPDEAAEVGQHEPDPPSLCTELTAHNAILHTRHGQTCQVDCTCAPIRDEQGAVVGFVLVARDITEQRAMEEQLHHAQKMDSIGQLAGGVAHDFNNMLSGILGATDLLHNSLADPQRTERYLNIIGDSAERAADLTNKLLSFSRKGNNVVARVDIHACIDGALAILEGGIDKRIVIERAYCDDALWVQGDLSQLQSAMLNLGLNARDAMPEGGRLRIRTECQRFDPDVSDPSLEGDYVRIVVSDTGVGMEPAVRERVFEPFFTTKAVGKGTGLGLAAVYGTISEHHGRIRIDSTPGAGTTITMLLPCCSTSPPPAHHALTRAWSPQATSCILLVDDDPIVRSVARRMLQHLGHNVIEAGDGESAIALYTRHAERIDAVLLDAVMPKRSGSQCLHELRRRNPDLKVLMTSGYSREVIGSSEGPGLPFLKKPYRLAQLQAALAELLGTPAAGSAIVPSDK